MISVREIAERLASCAPSAAAALLPEGKRVGGEWYASGSHSPLGYAVSVVLRGNKSGVVLFTGGTSRGKVGGDLLTLAEEIFGSRRAGIEWAKGFLGISDERSQESKEAKQLAERRRRDREKRETAAAARKASRVMDIWRTCIPLAGTLGETYLIKRGLAPSAWPESIRFCPALEWEIGSTRDSEGYVPGPRFPAIVAACQQPTREITAIWRIYLDPGTGGKAPIEPNKVGLGNAKGTAVRLGPASEVVGIGEGLETSLAIRELVDGEFPIWSTLSTSGMMNVVFPPIVRKVRIFADSDLPRLNPKTGETAPPAGLRAAEKLMERLLAEGMEVVLEPLPPFKTDFLDIVRGANVSRQR